MISIILSSRSLMCYSVSLSLLLILLVCLSFVIVFFSSDRFFFIFSSSSLKFPLCSSILFPSSVSILINNAFNSFYGKLFTSVSLGVFFSGFFSLFFHLKQIPVFSFCLTFSVSMKFGKSFTYPDLEWVSLCGSAPVPSACAQRLWWESWI